MDFQKQFESIFGQAAEQKMIERPSCTGKPAPVIIDQPPAPAEITAAWVDEAGEQ